MIAIKDEYANPTVRISIFNDVFPYIEKKKLKMLHNILRKPDRFGQSGKFAVGTSCEIFAKHVIIFYSTADFYGLTGTQIPSRLPITNIDIILYAVAYSQFLSRGGERISRYKSRGVIWGGGETIVREKKSKTFFLLIYVALERGEEEEK